MTVAMQLGNVVDGMIVGNLLGSSAMAAIEISMPVLLFLQIPAMMLQMIKTGNRSGHLDRVMEDISKDYEQEADNAIDNVIARFEPTMVAVLAVAVGLVLLSVMLPLVGVLSTIG